MQARKKFEGETPPIFCPTWKNVLEIVLKLLDIV